MNVPSKKPKAYQKGYQDFYGRDFIVTKDTLIPRPETEQIIDAVLNLAGKPYLKGIIPSKRRLKEKPAILDVGTGSGCIAITIKKELEDSMVYATDISKKALEIAEKNAKKHKVDISFQKSYLLESISIIPDLIVANLPYVDRDWKWLDKEALGYEPKIALYADNHGLALIYELINESKEKEVEYLILESDPCQHQDISNYAANKDYELLETRGFIQVYKLTFYTRQA